MASIYKTCQSSCLVARRRRRTLPVPSTKTQGNGVRLSSLPPATHAASVSGAQLEPRVHPHPEPRA